MATTIRPLLAEFETYAAANNIEVLCTVPIGRHTGMIFVFGRGKALTDQWLQAKQDEGVVRSFRSELHNREYKKQLPIAYDIVINNTL